MSAPSLLRFNYEKFAQSIVGDVIKACAILSYVTEESKLGNLVLGQKGFEDELFDDFVVIMKRMNDRTLHIGTIVIGEREYIITTVLENALYGVCTDPSVGGGIIFIRTPRAVLVATYTNPVSMAQAVPFVERLAEELKGV